MATKLAAHNTVTRTAHRARGGFALLLTIIVVSVTLAIGLSILNITLKQYTLATIARDSELAFHAASAALDCALEAERSYTPPTIPGNLPVSCVNQDTNMSGSTSDGGKTRTFSHTFTWNAGGTSVCSEFDVVVMDATDGTYTKSFTAQNISRTCNDGLICTTVFARGYNRACNERDSLRTVQRELTQQF